MNSIIVTERLRGVARVEIQYDAHQSLSGDLGGCRNGRRRAGDGTGSKRKGPAKIANNRTTGHPTSTRNRASRDGGDFNFENWRLLQFSSEEWHISHN